MKLTSVAPAEFLSVRRLMPADLPRAFALVRLVAPDLTLAAWRAMAERFGVPRRCGKGRGAGTRDGAAARSERCGILAVENAGGTIYALCSLRVVPDVVHHRRLDAETIIVVGIVDESLVRTRLAAALDREARARGCRAISLRDTPMVQGGARGLARGGGLARRPLAGAAPAASYEACATTAYRFLAS